MNRTTLAVFTAGLFTLPVQAQEIPSLEAIEVSATRVPTPDVLAPYASEVHARREIEKSGATTLYDYLAQHTSVNVMPGYGNRDTPLLDMRGYGMANGYENIVVSVDGRRLNNIDGMPQLLGSIPLADIERIEITKGSGAVMFGDGATAGSIQIYTRTHTGASIETGLGSHGARDLIVAAGLNKEKVSLSASAQYAGLNGTSDSDATGNRDASSNRTWRSRLGLRPMEHLKFDLDGASTRIDTRYVGPLKAEAFNANPAQSDVSLYSGLAVPYTHQLLNSDQWGMGVTAELNDRWTLTARHNDENKLSNLITFGSVYHYDYSGDDLALQYRGEHFALTTGVQNFSGTRISSSDRTRKENTGGYAQSQVHLGDTIFSAGARTEKVAYTYTPDKGAALRSHHGLNAWDLGLNEKLNERWSLFANYDRSFQAPDIDGFFTTDYTLSPPAIRFNGFIVPAVSHTLNLGLNHVTAANRLKLTLFHTKLDYEIYLDPLTWSNTNLEKTHKFGLELQDNWKATDTLTVSLNYSTTRALIDQASQNKAYDGKDLPGVPRHGATLGLGWQATPASHVQLTQTWRSQAYAANDFANDFSQKQAAYLSTDIAYRYAHEKIEYFVTVANLFSQRNGLWIADDSIYPVNFTRSWRVGMKLNF